MTKSTIVQYLDDAEALDCAARYRGETIAVFDRNIARIRYKFESDNDKTVFLMKHPDMSWIVLK